MKRGILIVGDENALGMQILEQQLAEQLNVSPQAVSKWENAAAMPERWQSLTARST